METLIPKTREKKISSGDLIVKDERVYLVQMTEKRIFLISLDGIAFHGRVITKGNFADPSKDIENDLKEKLVRGSNWFTQGEYNLRISKKVATEGA